jgi:hypothetical protein
MAKGKRKKAHDDTKREPDEKPQKRQTLNPNPVD